MRLIATIIIVTMVIFAALFTVLNATPVLIDYYAGKSTMPLSLLLVIALFAGAVLGVLASIGIMLRLKTENVKLKKELKLAENEVMNLRRLPLRDID